MLLKTVKLSSLDLRYGALRLTDPTALRRLRESVQQDGLHSPVLVSEGVEEGKLVLVDGFKRIRVLDEAGETEILARMEVLDGASAHAAVLACNRPGRGVTDLEEAWVVRSLHRGHRLPQVKIAALLGRHKSWVCRRLRLVEGLEDDLQDEIRLGLLSSSMARELTRLPRGNQHPAAQAIREHGLSTRQATRLVTGLWRAWIPRRGRQSWKIRSSTLLSRSTMIPTRSGIHGSRTRATSFAIACSPSRARRIV